MIGQVISHYRIVEKLGEGGMGVVYKAQDLKLKRTVALKFLPPDLTRDPEAKQRFIHEAQAASALQHNNICTIHDIDETDDGRLFIVMDCYQGEPLKEKIARGPMKLEEAVNIAVQVAGGLSKAHEKGIVHRDIKAANVFVTTDGTVKILDFGLAKLAGGQTRLTRAGSTLGTAAYMSPEQARGEEVDARTDIWSLGVVMYEMLTGHLPFRGEHEAALLYSIVHEEPQSLSDFRTDIPKRIASAIYQALQKDPPQRYQSALGLLNDLEAAMTPAIELPKQEKSIVVLPFENLSPDPDQEYFSDGLTEEVISDLSNVRALRVISRSSAMTFKGTKKKIPEIAREVNVQYVLEGSVRKAGNNLRITAQLIDATSDAHLWAEKYSGTLEDVFGIQEKVSRSIVGALKMKLAPDEERRISEHPLANVHAYECYQRARQEVLRGTEEGLNRALQLIETALHIVGQNELLYAALAYVRLESVNFVIAPDEASLKEVEECTKKIFALNPDSPNGHFFKGAIEYKRGNVWEAVRVLKRSFAKDPNNPNTLFYLSGLLGFSGKPSAGLPYATRLREIDPLTPLSQMWWAWVGFLHSGQFDDLLKPMQIAYQMDPEVPFLAWGYATALALNLRLEEAYDIIDRLAARTPDNALGKLSVLLKGALQGNKERALQSVTPALITAVRWDEHLSWQMADCYALLDQKVEALDWLEHASLNRGFINYPLLAEKDPWLANLRGEEQFKKLMERVKKEWEEFEV